MPNCLKYVSMKDKSRKLQLHEIEDAGYTLKTAQAGEGRLISGININVHSRKCE